MKLVRYGDKGAERPGLLDSDGRVRDLSAHVGDITGACLTRDGLAVLGRRLAERAQRYEASARAGTPALSFRSAWAVLAAVWALALLGAAAKLLFWQEPGRLGLLAYLVLGWLGVLLLWPLASTLPGPGRGSGGTSAPSRSGGPTATGCWRVASLSCCHQPMVVLLSWVPV